MDKRERVIKHLKALEKEKFIMDNMPAKFTWWYKEKENEHGVIGGWYLMTKKSGTGTPLSESDDIFDIDNWIKEYIVIPKSKQLSLF